MIRRLLAVSEAERYRATSEAHQRVEAIAETEGRLLSKMLIE